MIFDQNIPKLSKVKWSQKHLTEFTIRNISELSLVLIKSGLTVVHLTEPWNNVQNLVRKPCNVLEFFWPSALSCHMCASTLNVGLSHPTSREVPGSCRMQKKSALSSDTKVVNASKNFNYIWNGYNFHFTTLWAKRAEFHTFWLYF